MSTLSWIVLMSLAGALLTWLFLPDTTGRAKAQGPTLMPVALDDGSEAWLMAPAWPEIAGRLRRLPGLVGSALWAWGAEGKSFTHAAERLGAEVNAHTDKDHTAFHLRGLAVHAEAFLHQLGDLLGAPAFPEDELERERQVLLQEYAEVEDDPLDAVFQGFDRACWGTHAGAQYLYSVLDRAQRDRPRGDGRTHARHPLRESRAGTGGPGEGVRHPFRGLRSGLHTA